ncbi:MAG: T9SS type A sorting domain-containing protein [Bacteroidetes bacterium]|nr:T9SS type A sorting domain-containing protein [Bacteroidota bacterium]MBU1114426.1 T9SS type A sorting domain-containing protein [Bacteroidota bacterium]MBU1798829.1 T9SS type A sorting domain-containing protein [Bacteroidota bacterium]
MKKHIIIFLFIINIPLFSQINTSNCSVVSYLPIEWQEYHDIVLLKNNLFLVSKNQLRVIDISDKDNPKIIGSYTPNTGGRCYSMVAIDTTFAILGNGENGLLVLNIGNPSNIYEMYSLKLDSLWGEIKGISITDKNLFASVYSWDGSTGGIALFDIQNIGDVHQIDHYKLENHVIYDCTSYGGYVYAQGYSSSLLVLRLDENKKLSLISSVETNGQAIDIEYLNDFLYITNGLTMTGGEFLLLDCSKPSITNITKKIKVGNWCRDVSVTNEFIYVATDGVGVEIYKNTPNSNVMKVGGFSSDGYTYLVKAYDNYFYVSNNEKGLYILKNDLSTSIKNNNFNINTANKFVLEQNYPNPFNPTTIISYYIPESSYVTIKIYDVLGNEIKILLDQVKPAGTHNIEFDAEGLSNGIYFYKLITNNYSEAKKMILLK